MKKISIEIEKDILKLYLDQNLPTTKVALLTGVSSTAVSNVVKKNGYVPRNITESKKGIKIGSKLPIQEIINLYIQGNSSVKISKTLGYSKKSILNVLRNNNIKMRHPGHDKNYTNPLTDEIKTSYLSGKSIIEVMKITGLSYGGVNGILKKLNIIRTENKGKGALGKHQSETAKNKFRYTKKTKKENGLYDHIYLKKTGLTYTEFQKQLPEFKKYFKEVRTITNQQPLSNLTNFEKRGKVGQKGAYNIDHKFSIIEGFKKKINPKIIGHIINLEMITWEQNMTKQGNCSITLTELKSLIKQYNKGL